MDLTAAEITLLWRAHINRVVYGIATRLSAASLASASQFRTTRERWKALRTAGYLVSDTSQTASYTYLATDRIVDQVTAEPIHLPALWQNNRQYNPHNLAFVWFDQLSVGQQKTALQSAEEHQWYLLFADLKLRLAGVDPDFIQGPIHLPLTSGLPFLQQQAENLLRSRKIGGLCPDFALALQTPELVEHTRRVLRNEQLQQMLKDNLSWALARLAVLPEEQATRISSTDSPGWILGSKRWTNLGDVPEQWEAQLLTRSAELEQHLEQCRHDLDILRTLTRQMAEAGGWEQFCQRTRELLSRALDEKDSQTKDSQTSQEKSQ